MSEEVQTFRATNGRVTGVIGLVMAAGVAALFVLTERRLGRGARRPRVCLRGGAGLGGAAAPRGLGDRLRAADAEPLRGRDHPAGLRRHRRGAALPAGPLRRREVHLPGHQQVAAQDRAQGDGLARQLPAAGSRPEVGRLRARPDGGEGVQGRGLRRLRRDADHAPRRRRPGAPRDRGAVRGGVRARLPGGTPSGLARDRRAGRAGAGLRRLRSSWSESHHARHRSTPSARSRPRP